ncbi:hypothetical protein [Actinomadura sp. DC4]|uniref:hypothetical protein n=1 Tax=Actinomadura sp. DC4 TaxID=3055069 RepID=UPI0025B11027|nr:hypothetical protein [Actinomadura sp. DC4]MDN3352010.1 hypothetical protein [Actinomadura sp. DC4]
MQKLDITMLTRAADGLLEHAESPRHRQLLENYRRHALLEVTGRWTQIFAEDMTVEHPVYYLNINRTSVTLDGFEEVVAFYRTLTDTESNVIVLEDEQLAVADWGIASESMFNTYVRGNVIPDGDPELHYVVRQRIAMHWPYDERGRLIGEHVYEHADHLEVIEVPEWEFITLDEAREKLDPLIRPLPSPSSQ